MSDRHLSQQGTGEYEVSTELDGWKAFQMVTGAMVTFLAWFGARSVQKIDSLERNSVTREEHERSMALMRQERQAMHSENKTHLNRIEDIIRENEGRDSKTRHDIFNTVNTVSLQITALTATMNERQKNSHEDSHGPRSSFTP
jgi:hypothetical protein